MIEASLGKTVRGAEGRERKGGREKDKQYDWGGDGGAKVLAALAW